MAKQPKKQLPKRHRGRPRDYDPQLPLLTLLEETQTGLISSHQGPFIKLMLSGTRLLRTSRRLLPKLVDGLGAETEPTATSPAALVTMLKAAYQRMTSPPEQFTPASKSDLGLSLQDRVRISAWKVEAERWLANAGWVLLEFVAQGFEPQPARDKVFEQLAREISRFDKAGSRQDPFDPKAYHFLSFLRDTYLSECFDGNSSHADPDLFQVRYSQLEHFN